MINFRFFRGRKHQKRSTTHVQETGTLYRETVLDTVIPKASAFKVSLACRQPVEFYSPKSAAANLTRKLSREILDRIAMKTKQRHVA